MPQGAMRPGSRASRIVALVQALAPSRGGVTVQELRAAWPDGAPPASLVAEVGSLTRRGHLTVVGGRVGHQRYAVPGQPLPPALPTAPTDDVERVLAACRAAAVRLGRAVSTREVRTELRRQGLRLAARHPNAVRRALLTLASPRARGPATMRAPLEHVVRRAPSGRAVSLWRPAGVLVPVRPAPEAHSAAEALRAAVAGAQAHFGRPVRRAELALWLGRQADARPGALHPEELARRLEDVAKDDRQTAAPHPLLEIRTPFTCHGGPPPWYALRPPTAVERAALQLEDTATACRFAEEARSLRAVQHQARFLRSTSLEWLIGVRQATMAALVAEATGDAPYDAVLAVIKHAGAVTRALGGPTAPDRATESVGVPPDTALLSRIRPADGRPRRYRIVGEAALLTEEDRERWLTAALKHGAFDRVQLLRRLERVRRIPSVDATPTRFGPGAPEPLAAWDRVDFFEQLYGLFNLPRANTLLMAATDALGCIVRDPALVEAWAAFEPPAERERVAIRIAGALCGGAVDCYATPEPVEFISALLDGSGSERGWPPGGASRNLEFIVRVRRGFLLGAIE